MNEEYDSPKNADEYKEELLESVHELCKYWASNKDDPFGTDQFEGLAFAILGLFSGSINAGPFALRPVDPETGDELEPINGNLHCEFLEMIRSKHTRPRGTITLELSDVKIVRSVE